MDDYTIHEIKEICWLVVYVTFVVGILSLFFGLGAGGFERSEILQKNIFYIGYGVFFLIGVVAFKVLGIVYFGKKNKEVEGTILHDPSQGILRKLTIFKHPFLMTFFSIVFFGMLGWLASKYQVFFSDIPKYEMQFTKGADLFFSVYPASPSETLGSIFLISALGFFLGYMVMKGKLKSYWLPIMLIPGGAIISMMYGIINHAARYSGSDIAMSSVAVFWFVLGLITTISGSVIPALIMHDANNFFVRFSQLFSSEVVAFVTFTILGILMALFLLVWFKIRKRHREPT